MMTDNNLINKHDTVVIGQDETGKVVFMKTFNSKYNRVEMLEAYDYVRELYCYRMCDISLVKLPIENDDE